jgi:short-subunit dehydrogenase
MTAPFRLNGRTVLITGASSGIGRACAFAFAKEGATVVLAARRMELLEQVAIEVRATGGDARTVRCDVTSSKDVTAMMEQVQRDRGGLDVLINNAGLGLYGPLEALREEQLAQVLEINVMGLFRVTRAAIPLLKARGEGQIINVSSVLGHRGLPMLGGYCASKAAVNALTESLRMELKPHGIDVLLVSPGLTDTEFRDTRLHADGYQQEKVPLKAMSAQEVAAAMLQASRTRRRETLLTLPGRAMIYANRVSPVLFERFAGRMVGAPAPEPK